MDPDDINAKFVAVHPFAYTNSADTTAKSVRAQASVCMVDDVTIAKIVQGKGVCLHGRRRDRCNLCKKEDTKHRASAFMVEDEIRKIMNVN